MPTKIYSVELTGDAVQPITIPCGAQFLSAVRKPDRYVQMYFMGEELSDAMTMIVAQVHDDNKEKPMAEQSIRHIGSTFGIWESKFTTTHLFEILP